MAKVIKIAAIVVGVAALAFTGVGLIMGATWVAATTIAGIGFATITTALTLASTALALVSGITAKKPKLASSGQQLDFVANPVAGIPYVMGEAMVGMDIVHEATWGDKNKNLGMVGIISGAGPIQSYDGFYADNTLISFSGADASGYYGGFMKKVTQLGARPEGAALSMPGMPDWGAAYKLSGLAACGLTLIADTANGKVFSGGAPKMSHMVHGVKTYDARQDGTNGGSGAQRRLDETTYVYSENPWVHHGTYAMGRWENGIRTVGPGMPPDSIDWPSHIEAANVADLHNWTVSGKVYSTDRKWEVLKAIAQAGGGYPVPIGTKLGCLVNMPRVSLETITAEHVKGAVAAPQMSMRRDRLNGAIPRYRSPDHGWEIVAGDAVRNSSWVTEDGGNEHTREIEFALVADKDQAAQLAAYEVANTRERTGIQIELDLYWAGYKVGDCLTVDIPQALLVNQKCIVIGRTVDADSNTVTLQFRTETDAKHTWALGVAGGAPPPTTVVQPPGTGDTGSSVTGVDGPQQRTSFNYDYNNTPVSGEFPRTLSFNLNTPGGVVSSGVTWEFLVLNGTVNGKTNADGPQGMGGTGLGTLPVTSLGAVSSSVKVTATYNGGQWSKTFALTQDVAAPPLGGSGGGGGGGGPTTVAYATGPWDAFSSTSFVNVGSVNTDALPAGATTADIVVNLTANPGTSANGDWIVELRLMRGGVQIGTTQAADSYYHSADFDGDNAQFSTDFPDTGVPSGGATYDIEMRVSSGGAHLHGVTGTVSVTSP